MKKMGKWIDGVSPEDCVVEVAQRTLAIRLAAVEHYLPLAAHHAGETTENVHQLRVATRRARAAIALYQDFLPAKRARWIKKKIQLIRRAAGDARDCDVLALRLSEQDSSTGATQEAERILKNIHKQRREAQPEIVAVFEDLTENQRFHCRVGKLLERVRLRHKSAKVAPCPPFGGWASKALQPVITEFFAAAPGPKHKLSELHQFRIQGKKLRYAMELLAPAFPSSFRGELYPFIEKLQGMLGQVNDHSSAAERFERLIDECTDQPKKQFVRGLLQSEEQLVKDSRQTFHDWWTADLLAELKQRFDAILR